MPFTLAHGAAALPFRRFRLVPSALLLGTFAPDFLYFIRLKPGGHFGHTLLGTFFVSLPLALIVLWLFHTFVKLPMASLLPAAIQRRLADHLVEFRFAGAARFALIVCSVLVGIATHLAWDSFTHPNTWPYQHWLMLRQPLHLPIVGRITCYKALQHGSTIIGLAVLAIWLLLWYRTSQPSSEALSNPASPSRKIAIAIVITTFAIVGATMRAIAGTGIPRSHLAEEQFLGQLAVTAIALVWWQLVAYGVFSSADVSSPAKFQR
jgi:hypothetical protein